MQKYCFNCMNLLGSSPFCGRCGCDSRAAEPSAAYHLPRGTMLANRYIIGKTLGEGGFGITYIGMDTTLSKRVAVKEFYPAGIATGSAFFARASSGFCLRRKASPHSATRKVSSTCRIIFTRTKPPTSSWIISTATP